MFGNFGAMDINFGKMNLSSESINKLLNEPKTCVEDLLKEEELLQELRSQNQKLIDYFDREKIKRLLDYITKEQEDEQDKGYKFPFLCSQIFSLEIEKIMQNFFITNKQLQEEENKEKDKQPENEKNNENSEEKKKENDENKKEEENKKEDEVKEKPEAEPKKEEVKEEPKSEEPKKEEPKSEEPKKEEPKTEEPKKEEPKSEEPKKEEPKSEEPKKEEKKEEKKDEKKEKKDDGEDKKESEEENKEDQDENNKDEPENTENRIELLDYFFKFLEGEETQKLNYVLCGYFSSLVINLLAVNSSAFLKYVFIERRDILDKMVTHCYRKSISDTLSKLLHFENYLQNNPLDEETQKDMEETRNYIFQDIFDKIDINIDNEDLNSIYFLITGLFDPTNIMEEKTIFQSLIDNRHIMKSLITKPFHLLDLISFTENDYEKIENRRKNFSIIIDMILFFLTNIKKLKLEIPTSISDNKLTINHTKLSNEIFDNLAILIKNNFNKKNDKEKAVLQSFNELQLKPLGEYKIKIVDLLQNLVPYFKSISKFYDEILIETEFFKNAFDYLIQYEWNNLYQESLLSLLNSLFDEANEHLLLQEYLFNNLKIFELIKKYTNKEEKIKLSEETSISHGYYSFFISLSYKINTVIGGTPVSLNNTLLKQGIFTFISRVPEEGDKRGAHDLLYGFDDFDNAEENNAEKEKEKEEEQKKNYDLMQKYLNDEWSEYFGLNIEDVIKQYENKDWPEKEKKKEDKPFERASDNNENNENMDELENERDNNIFGDDIDDDDNKIVDRGRERQPLDDVNPNDFDFGDNNENKENKEENPFKNNNIKENDFEFDNNGETKEDKNITKNEENKADGETKEETPKKEEEVKEEANKEEKKESKNEETVQEVKKGGTGEEEKKGDTIEEAKKEEKIEEGKKDDTVKETQKEETVGEPKKEEKQETKEEENVTDKNKDK